jgi:Na+/pantothenate symporter
LATRATDNLQATMASVQTGIAELQLQSRQTGLNTDQLLRVTTKGHKDAAKIKILAQIATMFLPASLITVSLSPSNAIDIRLIYK